MVNMVKKSKLGDYRALNFVIAPGQYPLPHIHDCIPTFHGLNTTCPPTMIAKGRKMLNFCLIVSTAVHVSIKFKLECPFYQSVCQN